MKKFLIFILILLLAIPLVANDRKLYVDNFKNVVGNIEEEHKLLSFAQTLNIEELILYDLDKIHRVNDLTKRNTNDVLARFIKKAKTIYDMKRITASGESANFFIEVIHKYNKSRTDLRERFDVYNLEFEYWNSSTTYGNYYCENYLRKNGIPCTKAGAFNYFKESLLVLRLLSKELEKPTLVQAYIAKFTPEEVRKIEPYVDVLLVTCYERSLTRLKSTAIKNVENLRRLKSNNTEISILMSSEPIFMGGFFKFNSLASTEDKVGNHVNKHATVNVNNLSYTYYNYTTLAKSYEYLYYMRTGKRYAYTK